MIHLTIFVIGGTAGIFLTTIVCWNGRNNWVNNFDGGLQNKRKNHTTL